LPGFPLIEVSAAYQRLTRASIGKAAERAKLPPRDHRILMALLALARRSGEIPDSKQPSSIEKLAQAAHYGHANTQLALRHLEKHGWVTRTKGKLAGGSFTRYAVMIGTDCGCRTRAGQPVTGRAMTDVERARRYRDRKKGLPVEPVTPRISHGPYASERTAVYRFFAEDAELLYVGITNDVGHRWKKHETEKPWWGEVQRQTVDWFPSRAQAIIAEAAAIRAEHPKYNIQQAVLVSIAGRTEPAMTCHACGEAVPVAAAFGGLHAMCAP
jgi:predicted GIY-YIG superfamily endonuclease